LKQPLVTAALERDVVIIGHPVVTVDLIAFVEQKLGEMKADEPGGSGYEDAFHGCGIKAE
jgi:hypothetical protein